MKQYLKTAFVLFGICAVAAILLAAINQWTYPIIEASNLAQTQQSLADVSGGYRQGQQREGNGSNISYVVPLYDEGDNLVGYILELTGTGYGGVITMATSYYTDGSVLASKVISHSETPGLGGNAAESWYMALFEGLGGSQPLPTSRNDLPDPSLVSGASVTFNAVSGAIRAGSEYVKSLGGV